jgi:hypothetical protein
VRGPPCSHSIRRPERVRALSSTMDPSSAENLRASLLSEKPVSVSEKTRVDLRIEPEACD